MKPETPREIASELVSKWIPTLENQQPNYLHPLIDAIKAALDAERERCAKIADDYAVMAIKAAYTMGYPSEGEGVETDHSIGGRERARQIAAAIRGVNSNAD